MVKCQCLCTQDVHINYAIQWIQICNPHACVQRFTLKLTNLVLLKSVIDAYMVHRMLRSFMITS